MEALFKDKKIRVTKFRKAVYEVFANNESAISVNYIECELEDFDRITLYRTLKIFKENGLIHEITFPNREKMLALCKDDCENINDLHQHKHEHIHFRCNQCKEISCVTIADFPQLNLEGYQIDKIEIQAVGVCKECA